jgi:hypothetical protein
MASAKNWRTGLASRMKKARSRLKSVHAAFFVCARHGIPLRAGHAGGLTPCRFLLPGTPTCMCPPTSIGVEVGGYQPQKESCHD